MKRSVTKVIGSQFVALKNYIDFDISDLKIPDKVYYPVLMEILQENEDQASVKDALKLRKNELSPKHILVTADVIASVSYLLNLNYGIGNTDDIDHLGNRRLRTVGELLQNQIRIGLSRMERTIKERMTTQDISDGHSAGTDEYSSGDCCSKRIFRKFSAVSVYGPEQPSGRTDPQEKTFRTGSWRTFQRKSWFRGSRCTSFALWKNVSDRDSRRSEHRSDRLPDNIRRSSNEYGFIETPYRIVDKETGRVTDEIHYLTADDEEDKIIAQANEPLDSEGHFANLRVAARGAGGEIDLVPKRSDRLHGRIPEAGRICSYCTDSVPRKRRREPRTYGIQHAASGCAASCNRGSDRRNRNGT